MNNLFSIKKLVVIITGSSRGIGKSLVKGFRKYGATVIPVSRRHKYYTCDFNKEESIHKLVSTIQQHHKRIDVLINNAGMSLNNTYSIKSWDKCIKVNLYGTFILSKLIANIMKKHGGSIINITSIGSILGFPNNPAYQASKAAISQLTRAMAYDYAQFGIRINNVCPGYVKTSMTKRSYENNNDKLKRYNRTMLNRWATPEELIGPCIFLASNASSYMTATDVYVDGGLTSKGI